MSDLGFLLKFKSSLPFLFVSLASYLSLKMHFQELFLSLFLINIPVIL